MELEGKVALVTGGASGIGRATAFRLAQEGAKIGVLDIDEEGARSTAERIARTGGEAMPLVANVANPAQMESAVRALVERWGRLDIAFANAGINGVWAPVEDLKPEEWDETLDINLKGTFLTVKYAVPFLKKQGGAIVITSSINGTRKFSSTWATAYSASKAGQVALAKMIALELAQFGIRVNVICPGSIQTEISESTEKRDLEEIEVPAEYPEGTMPLTGGKPGSPEQVAELVLFLVSDRSSLISGTEVWIDGTESLLMG
jgi:NAD(P)-dependent dehydrogenase (short-subunit alcohol dehydrogenase family)